MTTRPVIQEAHAASSPVGPGAVVGAVPGATYIAWRAGEHVGCSTVVSDGDYPLFGSKHPPYDFGAGADRAHMLNLADAILRDHYAIGVFDDDDEPPEYALKRSFAGRFLEFAKGDQLAIHASQIDEWRKDYDWRMEGDRAWERSESAREDAQLRRWGL